MLGVDTGDYRSDGTRGVRIQSWVMDNNPKTKTYKIVLVSRDHYYTEIVGKKERMG